MNDRNTKFRPVTRANPCPVCEGNHKCSVGEDGVILCGRMKGDQAGFVCMGPCEKDETWTLYRRADDCRLEQPSRNGHHNGQVRPSSDWEAKAKSLQRSLTPVLRADLASALGLPETSLMALAIGYLAKEDCWTFPETDSTGKVIGISRRYRSGAKKAMYGGGRGLTIPNGWRDRDGAVFLPEGPSDVLTMTAMNLSATGRPSNQGGVDFLASLLADVPSDRPIVVIGENDERPDEKHPGQTIWPGRNGAERTAQKLAEKLCRPVSWALPPREAKDVRAWAVKACNLDPTILDAWSDAGERLSELLIGCAEAVAHTPQATGDPGSEWNEPIPLVEIPSAAAFPLEVFPPALQGFAEEGAKAMSCPPDYFAIPMLATAGGCIGNSRWLSITRTHQQSACLFACVVGQKGTAKSPALNEVREPLNKAQRERRQKWERDMVAWEEAHGDKKGRDRKAEPVMKRVIVGDVTTESLSILLDQNKRGLMLVRDELAGMMASMNQYKGGGGHDRQWFLEVWSHSLSPRDRKSDKGPVPFLVRPFVGIIGGTQPDVVVRFRGDPGRGTSPPDDGFLERWLLSYPAELPAQGETWLEISEESSAAWAECVERLLALEQHVDEAGELSPFFLHLDDGGKQAWQAFTDAHAQELNIPDFPDFLRGHWKKLQGYCGRLALILHLLQDDDGNTVGANAVESAVKLVNYFKSHARKVYVMMGTDARVKAAKRILGWIGREKRKEFKKWELHKDVVSDVVFPTIDSLNSPLELLESHGYIRQQPPPEHHKRGRPPSPSYFVNPLWNDRVNRENRE